MGLRYPFSCGTLNLTSSNGRVGAHYPLFLRRKYFASTWAKRIDKLLVHRHLNCKSQAGAVRDWGCVTKIFIRIVRRGDARRYARRVNWVIVKYNIFTGMYDVHVFGRSRRPNALLLGSNTIMHSLAATVAKQFVREQTMRTLVLHDLSFFLSASADTKYRMAPRAHTRMKINNSHREALLLNAK